MRVVLLTLGGTFPTAVLRRLLAAGAEPAALFCPTPQAGPRVGSGLSPGRHTPPVWSARFPLEVAGAPETAFSLARRRGLPVLPWDPRDPLLPLAASAPDLILVACFPYRLPAETCRLARVACLNLHPSLLPRYRGPYPVFWQLRAGERATGVTLHHVSERLDAGDVVTRRRVDLPSGASGSEIDAVLGEVAGDLASEAVAAAVRGESLARQSQQEAHATRQGTPGPEDFEIPWTWSARRAFDFLRGTSDWGQPYLVRTGERVWTVRTATGCQPGAALGCAWQRQGSLLRVQFSPGVLEVTVGP